MVDLSRFDLDIEDLKERMSDLEMEHESVLTRLTALETARATAPVSDDELVEALAKATFERETPRIWTGGDRSNPWLIEAQMKLDYIRAAGYDLVKRS